MTEEVFSKAVEIKKNLDESTMILNLLKDGCNIIIKKDDTSVEIVGREVKEKIAEIFSGHVSDLQHKFNWL